MVLAPLLLLLIFVARAEGIRTAQELFEENPNPDVPLISDPYIDPTLRLVNKDSGNGLAWDFVPELVTPNIKLKSGVTVQNTPEAAAALEKMFSAAQAEGIELIGISGYRSYTAQKLIYNRKVEERGAASAGLSSAPPGKSEHQLGLALDISCEEIDCRLNKIFADTKEGKWLYEHCAEYGFIIRYRSDWVKITGYKGEPWHVRYIGVPHAQLATTLNVPYEVYIEYLHLCYGARSLDMP